MFQGREGERGGKFTPHELDRNLAEAGATTTWVFKNIAGPNGASVERRTRRTGSGPGPEVKWGTRGREAREVRGYTGGADVSSIMTWGTGFRQTKRVLTWHESFTALWDAQRYEIHSGA